MRELTVKDLKRFYAYYTHFKRGYCCEQEIPNKSKYDLLCLGYNHGVYGWNWTLYADNETDTLYCTCYRNVPNYLVEK